LVVQIPKETIDPTGKELCLVGSTIPKEMADQTGKELGLNGITNTK
jgi:hypothetical protein